MKTKVCALYLVLLAFHFSLAAQDAQLANKIVEVVSKEKTRLGVKSVLFGVWKNQQPVITGALGESMTGIPAVKEMHVRAGAVTIMMLAHVVLQLVDEGKITLDDPIARWLPDLPQAEKVTLRMLLNCTSGYPDYVKSQEFIDAFEANVFREWSAQELIAIAMKKPLLYDPGNDWNYSHTNYVIVGEALEKISGIPCEELLKKRIAEPLNLRDTAFPRTAEMQIPVLHAFTTERGIYEDSTFWNPSWTSHSGRITSTIQDLGKWANALGGGWGISRNSFEELTRPSTLGMQENILSRYYALGLAVLNSWMVQTPRFGGYNGVLAYLPEEQIAIVVATTLNKENSPDTNYSQEIFSELVKELAPQYPVPSSMNLQRPPIF